jgi:hypothetical protein
MGAAGADVVGVDWRIPLDEAARRVGPGRALQGNLDPALLFAPPAVVEREALRVLQQGREAPGHIFNLGHGVLPETDPDSLTRSSSSYMPRADMNGRVIVIGGGISGLAAGAPLGSGLPTESRCSCSKPPLLLAQAARR